MKKRLTKKELQNKVRDLRRQNKKIVTTNGSFDILHAGHIYMLQKAKTFGDVLIVGLNSDKSIKKYKSKERPIINQRNRLELLSAIEMVDYIYLFDDVNPISFVEIVRPDIHINSSEYGAQCVEAPTVRKYGGRLVLIPKMKKLFSTTKIIEKIIKIYLKEK